MTVERADSIATKLVNSPLVMKDAFVETAKWFTRGLAFERTITRVLVYHTSNPDILREWSDSDLVRGLLDPRAFDPKRIGFVSVAYKQRLTFPWVPSYEGWETKGIEEIKSQAAIAAADTETSYLKKVQ